MRAQYYFTMLSWVRRLGLATVRSFKNGTKYQIQISGQKNVPLRGEELLKLHPQRKMHHSAAKNRLPVGTRKSD